VKIDLHTYPPRRAWGQRAYDARAGAGRQGCSEVSMALASQLMFFLSQTDPVAWGAGLPGSPIFAFNDKWEDLTVFLVPVRQWSDGTADR
jgi:hypothetical protein